MARLYRLLVQILITMTDRRQLFVSWIDAPTFQVKGWLDIVEYITSDTQKKVWVIRIPKHLPKRSVYAHDKA